MAATPELIAIVAGGVALFAFLWRLSRDVVRMERDLRQDMRTLEREMHGLGERFRRDIHELGERVARLEGIVETNNALLRVLVAERQPEAAG